MAHTKSALKQMRKSLRFRKVNRSVRSGILTLRTRLEAEVASGNREKAEAVYRQYCSAVDKALKAGVIKRNAADRRKSRGAARLAKMKA